MATIYYMRVHIESAGTDLTNGGKSIAGHMWYEIYQKDSNGNIISGDGKQLNAGYERGGITNDDGKNYAGDPAYSSKEIAISQEQFNTLFNFGSPETSNLATQHGFGNDDYWVHSNSCIDYVWKGLELAGINDSAFQGDLMPRWNRDDLDRLLGTGTYNDYHKLTLSERQGLAYQIANGDLSGILYGAYNPSNSFIPIRRNDPLVLDLNGDGIINTISMTNSKAFFDTNGDGMKELTGWISGEDELTLSFIKPMKCINNSLYKANFAIVA